MFEKVKKALPKWGLQIAPEKKYKEEILSSIQVIKYGYRKLGHRKQKLREIDCRLLMTSKDCWEAFPT